MDGAPTTDRISTSATSSGAAAPAGRGSRDCTATARAVDISFVRSDDAVKVSLSVLFALALASVGGCDPRPPLTDPILLRSPYPHTQVWAVVPFSNESGVSTADGSRVADQFVKVVEESDGLSCVALNRTLAAMQMLGMRSVLTDADAAKLRDTLGVDCLVVGTLSAWDPYPPPKIAMAVQVYVRQGTINLRTGAPFDPKRPAAFASGAFDASNHGTLAALRRYSASRHEPGGSYGEDIYLVEMGRFAEFASHELLAEILSRLAPPPPK